MGANSIVWNLTYDGGGSRAICEAAMGSTGSNAIILAVWRRVRHTSRSGRNSQHGELHHCRCSSTGQTKGNPDSIRPPPEYLPEMKDEAIVKNTIKALSPRIVAVHGPTGTGKSTVFPLAITHWSEQVEGLQQGLTICAQPRRISAQQLCERVRSNWKMHYRDRTVGYMIA